MRSETYWRTVHPAVRLVARAARAQRPVPLEQLVVDKDVMPGPEGVTDSIIVAASERTGSNLLLHTLRAAGYGAGEEFWTERLLWAGRVRWGSPAPTWRGIAGQARRAVRHEDRWWLHRRFTDEEFLRYHRLVEEHRSSPNGVFVIKLFRHDVEAIERRNGLRPIDVVSGRQHWVHLTRADRVGQAISYFRAVRTARWIDFDGSGSSFDPEVAGPAELAQIRDLVRRFEQDDVWWERQFERDGVTPVRIEYDELSVSLADTLNTVLAGVGGRVPPDVPAVTKIQRDEANDVLRERLLARYPELAERP